MGDIIQERITHYEHKFHDLIIEIDKDSILKTWGKEAKGHHTAGILVMMNKQINAWLDKYDWNKE